ncbi:MAG: efflux transporter outer membrane subunit [Deltaproteobacteria bacterium]|nr:efflux transporter outer membrane subunit [Deltaproteobacteria bacterium]
MRRNATLGLLLLLSGSLLVPGCAYRSAVKGKQFKLPKRFAQPASDASQPLSGRWWQAFEQPKLNQLMQQAFAESLSLKIARARAKQARAQLMAARAGWWPSVQAQVSAGRRKMLLSSQFQFTTNSVALSVAASYEFDIWGKQRFASESAERLAAASQEEIRAAYVSLAAELAEAYFAIGAARAQLELVDRTIESRERQLDLVKGRYRAGVANAVEVYQAEGNVAAARADREAVEQRIKLAEHALALLVGRFPGEIETGQLNNLPTQVKQVTHGVPSDLLMQRPDLRAGYFRIFAADAAVGAAFAAHFPSLMISGDVGHSFTPTGLVWSMLGGLTAPLFQGGRIRAKYLQNKAQLDESLANFDGLLRRAVKEVEDALVSGRAQEQRVKFLEAQAEAAENALRLATEQYQQGLLTYLTVLTTEQAAFAAKTQLINGRRELISSRIQLARAIGGDWVDRELNARTNKGQK